MKTKSTFCVITILIFRFIHSFSQAPVKQWDADFGGNQNEQFSSLQPTKDGGYIFGGYSESGISGDKTQTSRGSSDYWIVKTNENGIKQWDARFGGASVDQLTCLQQTSDGGYILGGISFSSASGDKSEASRGKSDYWIVKINTNGIKQWDATFGGTEEDELHSIQETSDGGYILGGSSISNISGDKSQNSKGGKDFWIVKTDANGTKQWDATLGANLFEELFSIVQTSDGGYISGGYSLSDINGDKTQHNRGRYDFWIVKMNAGGVKQWDKTFGGTDDDWLAQLQQTTDGGYILGGWSWSGIGGDKSQPTKGVNDYWLIKINTHGAKQWDADFGGNSNDYLTATQQTTDGGYILGGYSSSSVSGDKTQNTQGGTDYWAVRVDSKGMKKWDTDFGGSDFDFCYGTQQTTNGGFIIGGYSSSGISGDKTQATKGLNDYWIVKTTAETVQCNTPSNLSAVHITGNEAILKWNTVDGAIAYQFGYRKAGTFSWMTVYTTNYYKKLGGLLPNTEYQWRVRAICSRQPLSLSPWSAVQSFNTTSLQNAITEDAITVNKKSSTLVYPNPVLQSAVISFSLSNTSSVDITITDIDGRRVQVVATGNFSAGNHIIQFSRGQLVRGVYLLRIKTNESVTTKKIIFK
jgi:hypothetical protein